MSGEIREKWVDYTKIFACILVVLGHLLQGLDKANIEWNESLYYYIDKFIYIFHMPLFMCLSGYLYGKYTKLTSKKEYFLFLKKKLINLGIPYLTFYLLYVLVNMVFSSSVNSQKGIQDILNIFTNPIAPFWFLYILFFIFVLVPIIERVCKNNKTIIFAIFIILHVIGTFFDTGIYLFDQLMSFTVYFYLGVVFNEKMNRENKSVTMIANTIIFIVFGILYCYLLKNNIINTELLLLIKFALAVYGTLVSIQIFKHMERYMLNNDTINYIAKYTFPIFLMHTMFSAGIRIVLLKIGVNDFYIHFIFGLVLGIIGPIVIAIILNKIKCGNIVLYPIRILKKVKEC